jgi:hypothetical protein
MPPCAAVVAARAARDTFKRDFQSEAHELEGNQ